MGELVASPSWWTITTARQLIFAALMFYAGIIDHPRNDRIWRTDR
jgi:hypothetical protein